MARLARFRPDLLAAGGTVRGQRKAINQRDFRSPKAIAPSHAILLILFGSLALWAGIVLIIKWLPRLAWIAVAG